MTVWSFTILTMASYTSAERLILFYSPVQTFRALREACGPRSRPSTRVITRIVNNFEENHTLLDRKKVLHKRPVRTPEKIQAARRHVEQNPKIPLRRRSQPLNVSRTSLQRILTVDLKLHPYKIKLIQRLKPVNHEMRCRFVNWSHQKLGENPEFSKFVILSDDTHFQMDAYVNKENCRYQINNTAQIEGNMCYFFI